MKKLLLGTTSILILASLTACGKTNTVSPSHTEEKQTSTKQHKINHPKKVLSNKSSKKHTTSKNTGNQQTSENISSNSTTKKSSNSSLQASPKKSQGEINRERGYDPNGAPLLPGQDHAAGDNPDGTPDAWVQGQVDWLKENGYLNEDGSPTQKEKDAEAEVANNPDDNYNP